MITAEALTQDIRVGLDNVVEKLLDSLPVRLRTPPEFEILDSVVVLDTVDVMDVLARHQSSTQMGLHHEPVVGNPTALSPDQDVAAFVRSKVSQREDLVPTSGVLLGRSLRQGNPVKRSGVVVPTVARTTEPTTDRLGLSSAYHASAHDASSNTFSTVVNEFSTARGPEQGTF